MTTLIGILTALGAIAIWIIRAVNAARAAHDIARTVNNFRNSKRRARGQYEDVTLETLDDPQIAAFAILHAIVNEDPIVTPEKIAAIDNSLMTVVDAGPQEAAELSKKAQELLRQSDNPGAATSHLVSVIRRHCTPQERAEFREAMRTVMETGPEITDNAKSAFHQVQQRLR